jgi:hypothetical protein
LFYSPFLNQHGAQVVTPDAIHGKDIATGNDKSGNHVNALGNTTDDTTNSRGNSNANNVDRVWNRFTDATSGNKAFYALSEVLTVQAIGGGNTFADWIDDYPGVGGLTGLGDDADGDGIDNGVENFFGTDPSASSGGLVAGAVTGNTFTFTHPQNATPADGVTAAYRWSKDLATFRVHGQTDGAGTTVNFNAVTNAGVTTVTATVTGTSTAKLFVDVKVVRN